MKRAWVLLALAGCAPGAVDPEATAAASEAIVWTGHNRTDIGVWQRDDVDWPDSTLIEFTSQAWTSAEPVGLYVDMPETLAGDVIVARFVGQMKGDWLNRASVRLCFTQNAGTPGAIPINMAGAQEYIYQPLTPEEPRPVNLQGSYRANVDGTFRVGLKGKVFAGTAKLFGSGTLLVERYRVNQ